MATPRTCKGCGKWANVDIRNNPIIGDPSDYCRNCKGRNHQTQPMQINHIGKNAESKLIGNEIEGDYKESAGENVWTFLLFFLATALLCLNVYVLARVLAPAPL